mgnify:CR=1 FL=1
MGYEELLLAWEEVQIEDLRNIEPQEMHQLMHRPSQLELAQIKRSLRLKFLIGGAVFVLFLILATGSFFNTQALQYLEIEISPLNIQLFLWSITISLSLMLAINYRAYQRLQALQTRAHSLKAMLEEFILAMEKAIRFNIYSDTLMTPILITWAYYIKAYEKTAFQWGLQAAFLLLLPLIIGTLSYYFQRYQQELRFGQYLQRLKSILRSLEE